MTEHPRDVDARQNLEAWNSGRMHVIREYFSEDVVLHFAGNNAMSRTCRGREAVMDALVRASQGGRPQAELEAAVASDDRIIVYFGDRQARRSVSTMDIREHSCR